MDRTWDIVVEGEGEGEGERGLKRMRRVCERERERG